MSYTEIQCKVVKKGRKKYRCSWCNDSIEVSESHKYRAYHWEGDFNTDRMHLECFVAMENSPSDLVSEGWLPGEQKRGELLK